MKLLLDTNICIPLINRAEQDLADRLLACSPRTVVLCSVVKAELYFGARASGRAAENLERVERFCRAFHSVPFGDHAAERYGAIRAQLRREGRPIGANDLLIAAVALANELTLVTRNVGEFRRVPGLNLQQW